MICIRPSSSFGRVDRPHCGSGGIRGCEPDDESATKQHGAGWPGGDPAPATPGYDTAATAGDSALEKTPYSPALD